MRYYLDTSVALHAVLPWGDQRAREWIDSTRDRRGELYASTLLGLEMARALRREQLGVALGRPLLDRIEQLSIDDGILQIAAAIEPHVKSLDAIHLANCLLLGPALTLATHDGGMRQAAESLGLATIDPLA